MPAFKDQLSAKQIQDVAAFVFASTHSLARKRPPEKTKPARGMSGNRRSYVSRRCIRGEPANRILQTQRARVSPGRVIFAAPERETEKEGFEPSRQGFPHLTP